MMVPKETKEPQVLKDQQVLTVVPEVLERLGTKDKKVKQVEAVAVAP